MPRRLERPPPSGGHLGDDWYLRDWMAALNLRQADLERMCDIPKATMSSIFNGKTAYRRELVNLISSALNIRPYELLMHPDDAMAIRRLRASATQIAAVRLAADDRLDWQAPPIRERKRG